MKTLVLYYTKTGHTLEAVNPMVEGLKSTGSTVDVVAAADFDASSIASYDAFIVGSPCWAGSIGKSGVAGPLVKALKKLDAGSLKGKRCGGISVHGKKGGVTTVSHLERLLSSAGCNDYQHGPVAKAGTLGGITKGPSVTSDDAEIFRMFGVNFSQ